MANKIKFVLKQGKESLELGSGSDFGILDYSGIEASDYTLSLEDNAQLDGATIAGKKVEPRPITIKAEYRKTDKEDKIRQKIIRFFNPKKSGELTVTFGNITRKIGYEIEGSPQIEERNIFRALRFSVNLLCPAPYFQDVETFAKNMAGVREVLAFPLVFPPRGLVTSYREMQQVAVFNNKGDKAIGLNVLFEAKGGGVTNPVLYNLSTGEFLRVEIEMNKGDKLTICTIPGKKRVELNGKNAIQYIDRNSRFFAIAEGETLLKYDADEGRQNLDVYPRYTPEYLGV